LRLQRSTDGLPELSGRLGQFVRTNSEALIGVTTRRKDVDLSKGIAIGSILETDEHSHLEPVRSPEGAGFFRLLQAPQALGRTLLERLGKLVAAAARHPVKTGKAFLVRDWAKSTLILLYMRTLEGHLTLRLGRGLTTGFKEGLTTTLESGP